MTLFAGYPLIHHFTESTATWQKAITNGTGQIPSLNLPQLIDPDTPDQYLTRTGFDGEDYELVFSDEFNKDGRSFYPGDDPFWEAVDLWVRVALLPALSLTDEQLVVWFFSIKRHRIWNGMILVCPTSSDESSCGISII